MCPFPPCRSPWVRTNSLSSACLSSRTSELEWRAPSRRRAGLPSAGEHDYVRSACTRTPCSSCSGRHGCYRAAATDRRAVPRHHLFRRTGASYRSADQISRQSCSGPSAGSGRARADTRNVSNRRAESEWVNESPGLVSIYFAKTDALTHSAAYSAMREHALFTIRNLLKGNQENQEFVYVLSQVLLARPQH